MTTEYRERLYAEYVGSTAGTQAVGVASDLTSRRPYLERLVVQHFPDDRDSVIVDLGCGAGALIRVAIERGYRRISGVDISGEQVACARAAGLTVVSQGDLRKYLAQTQSKSIDVVISFDVIEHFTKDELVAFGDEVARVLRPGGRWILHAPNGGSPFGGRVRWGDFTHEQAFTPSSLRQLLLASGFASVECFEDTPVVHGLKSSVRWALWLVVRTALRVAVAAETGQAERGVFSQNLLAVGRMPGSSKA